MFTLQTNCSPMICTVSAVAVADPPRTRALSIGFHVGYQSKSLAATVTALNSSGLVQHPWRWSEKVAGPSSCWQCGCFDHVIDHAEPWLWTLVVSAVFVGHRPTVRFTVPGIVFLVAIAAPGHQVRAGINVWFRNGRAGNGVVDGKLGLVDQIGGIVPHSGMLHDERHNRRRGAGTQANPAHAFHHAGRVLAVHMPKPGNVVDRRRRWPTRHRHRRRGKGYALHQRGAHQERGFLHLRRRADDHAADRVTRIAGDIVLKPELLVLANPANKRGANRIAGRASTEKSPVPGVPGQVAAEDGARADGGQCRGVLAIRAILPIGP